MGPVRLPFEDPLITAPKNHFGAKTHTRTQTDMQFAKKPELRTSVQVKQQAPDILTNEPFYQAALARWRIFFICCSHCLSPWPEAIWVI